MISLLSKISLLVELVESKDACEMGLSCKEGHDTVRNYLDHLKEHGISLSHLVWARKNFEGDVNDAILFEYSKMFIDAIGKDRATKRFKKLGVTLTTAELDYLSVD